MKLIIKTCHVHGDLIFNQIIKFKRKSGDVTYKCRLCRMEIDRKREKKRVDALDDYYIKKILYHRKLSAISDQPIVIECMRAILQLKRLIKEKQKNDC